MKNKKSAFRWTTSIIHKLLLTVWDIWNFRNSLIYGKGGINQRELKRELDIIIRQEFEVGLQNLLEKDKHLREKYTKSKLVHDSTNVVKQHWIRAVTAARIAAEKESQESQDDQQSITRFLEIDNDDT